MLVTLSAAVSVGILIAALFGAVWLSELQQLELPVGGRLSCPTQLWELSAGLVYTLLGLTTCSILLLLPRAAYLSRRNARLTTYQDEGRPLGDTV